MKMSVDELAYHLWAELPDNERSVNIRWLEAVFKKLKIGGIWAYPHTGRLFRRVDEDHFEEVTED